MPITLRKFNAEVRDQVTGDMKPAGLLSSDALGAINEAKTDAISAVQAKQTAAETAVENKGAETLASIPQDYTSLDNEVDDLKTQLSANGALVLAFEHGSLSNGENSTYYADARIRTPQKHKYDADLKFDSVDRSLTNAFSVSYYNDDGTFKESSGWVKTITIPKGSTFRILASLTPNANTPATLSDIISGFTYSFVLDDIPESVAETITNLQNDAQKSMLQTYGVNGELYSALTLTGNYLDGSLFEKGSMNSGQNSSFNASSRMRNKTVQFAPQKIIVTSQSGYKVLLSKYGNYNFDSFVESVTWAYTQEIPAGTYYRLLVRNDAETETDLDTLISKIAFARESVIRKLIDDIGSKEIPDYYYENNYIQNKATTITSYYGLSSKLVTFGWITDTHVNANAGNSFKLFKYLDDHTNSVPFVVFGGDLVGHTSATGDVDAQSMAWLDMMSDYDKYRVLSCRGNHDLAGDQSGDRLHVNAEYMYVVRHQNLVYPESGKFYYYYDVPFTDTRIIVVNDYESTAGEGAPKFSQDQINWILNTALNVSNKNIVFVTHNTADPDMYLYDDDMEPLQLIMDGLNQKANVNATSKDLSVIHDFTNTTNTMVFCLCGHGHKDEYHVDAAGVLTVMTCCDANASSQSGYDRTVGTVNEQCFDIVTIDTENKNIYMTRIGAGSDRQFTYGT